MSPYKFFSSNQSIVLSSTPVPEFVSTVLPDNIDHRSMMIDANSDDDGSRILDINSTTVGINQTTSLSAISLLSLSESDSTSLWVILSMFILSTFIITIVGLTIYFWHRLVLIEQKLVNISKDNLRKCSKGANVDPGATTNNHPSFMVDVVEPNLSDKTVVITGGNDGIGAQLAHDLAAKGARLVLLCRDVEKGDNVANSIVRHHPTAQVSIQHIDLASLTSVRVCANEVLNTESRIDALIHCASVAYVPAHTKSVDGHELHLATNYLGPFLLSHLLVERMKRTATEHRTVTKVIHCSSIVHRVGQIDFADLNLQSNYSPVKAYSQSKLAMLLASREQARRWQDFNVHVYNVQIGCTATKSHYQRLHPAIFYIVTVFGMITFHTIRSASKRLQYCLLKRSIEHQTGYYYVGDRIKSPATQAMDENVVRKLWTLTAQICEINVDPNESED